MSPSDPDADASALTQDTNNSGDYENDFGLMASDDSSRAFFPPPPRIAARFYRDNSGKSSGHRRRSSAASSRRTSISSAHSHHSHRSYHGPQSSHIAQQLRRASIIESRKARLADRAAHAEQVRLRAAMAKAASSRMSTSEERFVAAEKARQKYLAQVAAVCAEEVRRAKRVAEEMKERREAEGRKLRGEMEERLAEAERRRAEYQKQLKRGRTTSVPRAGYEGIRREAVVANAPTVVDRGAAVVKIQRAWRRAQRQRAVRDFVDLGLSIDAVRNIGFEEVGALLGQDRVLRCTSRVLGACEIQDTNGLPLGDRTAVRTFLSAYLILGHPAQVLSQDGEQEQDLVIKAQALLGCFEQVVANLGPSNHWRPSAAQIRSLSATYHAFVGAFSAWKAHDADTLLQTMLAQYVELDRIWQTIKGEGEEVVKAEYRDGIRENQILLLARIKRLAGPEKAKTLIRDAIRQARRSQRQSKKSAQAGDNAISVSRDAASSVTLPLAGGQPNSASVELDLGSAPQPSASSSADTQAFEDILRGMSVIPDNRTLIHELAINKDYRIDAEKAGGINAELRRNMQHVTFQEMRGDVNKGQGERWIVAMTVHIRSRLLRLLTPGNSLHVLISEALDPDVVARECAMGNFSYERFFDFMLTILPKLCAPFRDPDVASLAQDHSGDVIDRLERLMHVIDLLSLDFANFLLHESAPRLLADAPAYEARCFAEDLENGTISLQRTERWWTEARDKAFAEANRRDPEGVNHPANRPSARKIYFQGLTDLFIAVSELDADAVPETLRFDHARIAAIRADTLRIVTVASMLLSAKNLLKRDVRSPWKTEASRIWDILKDASTTASNATSNTDNTNDSQSLASNIQSVIESAHNLPPAVKTQMGNLTRRFISQAQSRTLTDPVMRLLFHRLKTHVLSRLLASSTSSGNSSSSSASGSFGSLGMTGNNGGGNTNESLTASGMCEFVGKVGEMTEEIRRVGEVDRAAHARWYDELASSGAATATAGSRDGNGTGPSPAAAAGAGRNGTTAGTSASSQSTN